jgi:hypothetical protein
MINSWPQLPLKGAPLKVEASKCNCCSYLAPRCCYFLQSQGELILLLVDPQKVCRNCASRYNIKAVTARSYSSEITSMDSLLCRPKMKDSTILLHELVGDMQQTLDMTADS